MKVSLVWTVNGEQAMVGAGQRLGKVLVNENGGTVFFHGQLGSGKTTLCRGVLRACGHVGVVKSPTYTLVEPYHYRNIDIYHFDLYRLGDPEELEYVGIRDYFSGNNICLVEWPERGEGMLPGADVHVFLDYLRGGRIVKLVAGAQRGENIIGTLRNAYAEID